MAEGYLLTEADRRALQALLDRERRRPANTPNRPRVDWDEHQAPETYVAKVPEGGLPGLDAAGTGTGTFYDHPGFATLEVYRVIQQTGTVVDYDLRPVPGLTRRVFSSGADLLTGGTWVIVSRDKFGSWWVMNARTSESAVVLVGEVVDASMAPADCTGTPEGIQCPARLHLGMVQQYSAACDRWENDRCVWIAALDGQTLQNGRRYRAFPVTFPTQLAAVPIPVDAFCEGPEDELWMVDAGDPVVTVRVEEQLGLICDQTGTGSFSADLGGGGGLPGLGGGSTVTNATFTPICDDRQALFYRGRVIRFDHNTCTWIPDNDDVYLMETCGRELPTGGYRLQAEYHTMIAAAQVGDTEADNDCAPLYLVPCPGFTGVATAIESIDCVPNASVTGTGTDLCGDADTGDKVVVTRREVYVCGHLVSRVLVRRVYPCCCTFGCFPGAGTIDCPPCDAIAAYQRADRIVVTIDTGGQCACLDGSYVMLGGDGGYYVTVEACGNFFNVALLCVGGTWYAQITCDPCPSEPPLTEFTGSPDNPDCMIVAVASVTDCRSGTFSGSSSTGACLTCRVGTCTGFCGVTLTFTG